MNGPMITEQDQIRDAVCGELFAQVLREISDSAPVAPSGPPPPQGSISGTEIEPENIVSFGPELIGKPPKERAHNALKKKKPTFQTQSNPGMWNHHSGDRHRRMPNSTRNPPFQDIGPNRPRMPQSRTGQPAAALDPAPNDK
jgi:hypothetical protein